MTDNTNEQTTKEKKWGATIFIALLAAIFIFDAIDSYLHPKTPEQIKAESAAAAARSKTALEHTFMLSALCHQQVVCKKYGTARQECATAGDFNNCIKVKLG